MGSGSTHSIVKSKISLADFYKDHMEPALPIVIQSGAEWPAFERWSVDYLREYYGDKVFEKNNRSYSLNSILDAASASTEHAPNDYMKNLHLQSAIPEMREEVVPPLAYAEPNFFRSLLMTPYFRQADPKVELFIGGAGTRIPYLHYDEYYLHNFITQIVGKKDFYFIPPEQGQYLYPLDDNPYLSKIRDPRNPDLEQFPLFANVEPQCITVNPGETVYVAPGWWHWTIMHEPSIAIGHHCINATNWQMWVDDICAAENRDKRISWKLMHTYLTAIGPLLSKLHSTHF